MGKHLLAEELAFAIAMHACGSDCLTSFRAPPGILHNIHAPSPSPSPLLFPGHLQYMNHAKLACAGAAGEPRLKNLLDESVVSLLDPP